MSARPRWRAIARAGGMRPSVIRKSAHHFRIMVRYGMWIGPPLFWMELARHCSTRLLRADLRRARGAS